MIDKVGSIITTWGPIIGAGIQIVEKLFGKGDAANKAKKDILQQLVDLLNSMVANKTLPGSPVPIPATSSDDSSRAIEAILAALKITPGGMPTPTPGIPTSVITLPGGAMVFGLTGTLTANAFRPAF